MASPARVAAFRTLRALASARVDLGEALSRARDPLGDPRDRALATDLVLGTLRWRAAIDYQLQQRSQRPLDRLDQGVLDALRLGAYQLIYLERVPVSAAVNDAVSLVKAGGFVSAAGFANAVLRRLARERGELIWPERPASIATAAGRLALAEFLAVVHSHPRWLVARWLDRQGVERTEAWLRFNNEPPAMTVAVNRLRGDRTAIAERLAAEGVDTRPTPHARHGLIVRDGQVLSTVAYRDGACLVQDEASQLVGEIVDARDGQRAFDVCAAPGGKTVAMAAQCAPSGMVVATDVRPRRVRLLLATLARCRVPSVHVARIPTSGALPFRTGAFDRILVDAPCSGLGTVRRDPDIRWRRGPGDLTALAAAQRDLLARVAPVVAPGGRLIYSTCSSEPEENEDVVAGFLARAHDYRVLPVAESIDLPATVAAMQTSDGYLRTDPTYGLEAFFAAVLEKKRL